ncbi:MAG TPA: hypothetical protein VFF06_11560 [Polyangia bacterium]|nr:hypothetical protein [Polyangia bacterium]
MRRDTLALFFRRAIVAALPLVAGCGPSPIGIPGPGPCGGAQSTWTVDGGLADLGCDDKCAGVHTYTTGFCSETTNSAGQPIVECHQDCTGRRPAGLRAAMARGDVLGRHFARMAHLEAASVPAFRRLRAELRAHGAPKRLLDACTRAARDEVRHARAAARLARRFGAAPPRVVVDAPAARDLAAIAVENAREGCVRETFGALVATWQARAAEDGEVRAVMTTLAADETRHAELSWEIDAWLRSRLAPAERARVEEARRAELAALASTLDACADETLARATGLPPPHVARALHRTFAVEIARRGAV